MYPGTRGFHPGRDLTLRYVVEEIDVSVSNPQVGVVVLERVGAVDGVLVVADHRPLLETGPLRALEGDPAPVPVAQVIDLERNTKLLYEGSYSQHFIFI